MRLTFMHILPRSARFALSVLAAVLTLSAASVQARAQAVAGSGGDKFKDTSMLKLPPGQKAAIYEWEDMECPACAHHFPIVHAAVDKYHIPLIRHDFPLVEIHIWSTDAAITARYLQDKVSPDAAYQFRRDIFANQQSISSKDDLQAYTAKWFAAHKLQMPFMMGPNSLFAAEVQSDRTLGERLGVRSTPTIIVVGPNGWTQVTDITQLYSAIDHTLEQSAAPAAHNNLRKPVKAQN